MTSSIILSCAKGRNNWIHTGSNNFATSCIVSKTSVSIRKNMVIANAVEESAISSAVTN
ncbi:hypothetical protein [Candidatus Nitrosocosmicus sp. SS]|uniref:hypothetical protein n=1 Tax=Candidatus Nitrosocosmicus agrestis TaxID=2563600 RepID=UPI0012B54D3C|nr:hypothetical protein [Candidatus Nitrosocosmicus sp. SS]